MAEEYDGQIGVTFWFKASASEQMMATLTEESGAFQVLPAEEGAEAEVARVQSDLKNPRIALTALVAASIAEAVEETHTVDSLGVRLEVVAARPVMEDYDPADELWEVADAPPDAAYKEVGATEIT